MERTIFHGSGETVVSPNIRIEKFTKDFGYGFYCTLIYSQAKRWAIRSKHFKHRPNVPTVNLYTYRPNPSLSYLKFDSMTEEWLDFIAMCRSSKGIIPHNYDIVEGPMADDDVWNYVEDFLAGAISRNAFWELAKFKNPTHQISFHTKAALDCLTFERVILENDNL